jgi:hypothetical protein
MNNNTNQPIILEDQWEKNSQAPWQHKTKWHWYEIRAEVWRIHRKGRQGVSWM